MKAKPLLKPLLRGHFHQAAFFIAAGACAMLIFRAGSGVPLWSTVIYTLGLCGLFGVSALYHRPHWSPKKRAWMRRLDHAAIFALIGGTFTPICLLGIRGDEGARLLRIVSIVCALGGLQSLFWAHAPKWVSAILYVGTGWMVVPFVKPLIQGVGSANFTLLAVGGAIYTVGAVVYASRRPNPAPRVFGYHEIFHLLVIIAAIPHFVVVARLVD